MGSEAIHILLGNALTAAGVSFGHMRTSLEEDGRMWVTTIEDVDTRDAQLVLLGFHAGDYGTSVEIEGDTVVSRQLNK